MSTVLDRPVNLAGRDNPVLLRLVAAIRAAYGPRIERIVLFGSRARGDAEEDSDYDVAVFMRGLTDRHVEIRRLLKIERSVVGANDPIFEVIPMRANSWDERFEFVNNVRDEGIPL